jgi:outer membrane lipoprotein SlyB
MYNRLGAGFVYSENMDREWYNRGGKIVHGRKIMKNVMMIVVVVFSLLGISVGCASKALDASRAGTISESYSGVVQSVEAVSIKGDGKWTSIIGMIAGGVLGNQLGEGSGKDLATMGGTMVGAVAGEEADVRDAQRITVRLDSGKTITTVLPIDANNPNRYRAGDQVTLYITNGRVTEIR